MEDLCCRLGARRSRPGEFTERAFLNGKIDLIQAEAVADLIGAKSQAAVKASLNSLQGVFSKKIRIIQQQLTSLRVWVESSIDFSDEDVDFLSTPSFLEKQRQLMDSIKDILLSGNRGAVLNNGVNIAIVGPPNAGKSSLMNALTLSHTSIVTDRPGTTRDVIKESITVDGVCFNLLDTAGLRHSEDSIEIIGIQRTLESIQKAEYCLLVFDQTTKMPKPEDFWEKHMNSLPFPKENHTVVLNKSDCIEGSTPYPYSQDFISISAKSGAGVEGVIQRIKAYLNLDGVAVDGAFSSRTRQMALLEQVMERVESSFFHLNQSQLELASEDLRLAQLSLGEVLGEVTSDDLLGEIFSTFCIGK
jgi:tRNA modification GTPase